jgi:hypothetical protein
MAAKKYVLGNAVIIPFVTEKIVDPYAETITYAAYDPVDNVYIVFENEANVETTITYPDSRITKSVGVGKFYVIFKPDVIGKWRWKWVDPSSATPLVIDGSFTIIASKVDG